MLRWAILCGVVLLCSGLGVGPLRADDSDTCVNGSGEAAIAACGRVLTASRSDGRQGLAWALTSRGNAFRSLGQFDRAITDYDEALKLDPTDATAFNNRGNAYQGKGDLTRAIADYDQAIKINPKYAFAFNNRANAFKQKGELDRAIADFDQAIAIDPAYTAAYTSRGLAYEAKGDRERAKASFNAALSLPQKYNNGQWAHDTAREHMAALGTTVPRVATTGRPPPTGAALASVAALPPVIGTPPSAASRAPPATAPPAASPSPQPAPTPVVLPPVTAPIPPAATPAPPTPSPVPPVASPSPPTVSPTPAALPPQQATDIVPERRIALVIGNGHYRAVSALTNPANDARAVADQLKAAGFDTVHLMIDASRDEMVKALRSFADEAEGADWSVVYYAGHGLEIGGVNYLIPTDARLRVDRDAQDEAISLNHVLDAVTGARKLKMVILDACRDNPFLTQMRRTLSSLRGSDRGLARIEPDGATLVVYAAKDGEVADDGEGEHSPFTTALLKRLAQPGIEINRLFRQVTGDVLRATQNRQRPFVYGSIPGDEEYFFRVR